jgi:preprotein translocase subunit SecE
MADELIEKKESWIESTRQYLTDIRGEMKRVTWPSRAKVESTTWS